MIEAMGSGAKELSGVSRVDGEEILAKFVEPFGLHDVLHDPFPRGESFGGKNVHFCR